MLFCFNNVSQKGILINFLMAEKIITIIFLNGKGLYLMKLIHNLLDFNEIIR